MLQLTWINKTIKAVPTDDPDIWRVKEIWNTENKESAATPLKPHRLYCLVKKMESGRYHVPAVFYRYNGININVTVGDDFNSEDGYWNRIGVEACVRIQAAKQALDRLEVMFGAIKLPDEDRRVEVIVNQKAIWSPLKINALTKG